jgi:hypothetical protein
LDIVVCNTWGDTIGIFLGFGNGTFGDQITYATTVISQPIDVAIGDFNEDTYLDIVVASNTGYYIGIFFGYGNVTFSGERSYALGYIDGRCSVAVGDLNNDNRLDFIVLTSKFGSLYVFLGHGNGDFSLTTVYYAATGYGSKPISIVVADFNHDSNLDLAVTNSGTESIDVFLGYGNGTLSRPTTYQTGRDSFPYFLITGDLNNDNQLDIVISDSNSFGVLLGCGDGTFLTEKKYFVTDSSHPVSIAVGDFNNDNRLDIIVTGTDIDTVYVFLGYVSETFVFAPFYSTGAFSQPASIAVGDFNNDTRLDVVVANNGTDNVMVIFGSGYGTFVSHTSYSTGNNSYPCGVAVGDLNNDSRLDIVVANSGTNSIGIFLSNGTGTFSSQMTYSTGFDSRPYSVAVLDFNNDAQLDIAVANYGSNSVIVFFGDGDGNFSNQSIFDTGFDSRPYAVTVGDVNNDNLTDIVVTNNGYGTIDILFKEC